MVLRIVKNIIFFTTLADLLLINSRDWSIYLIIKMQIFSIDTNFESIKSVSIHSIYLYYINNIYDLE